MEKNNVTELVFILDKSGSMAGLEADTVGGFNAMLEKQKTGEGKVYVSTVLFANESEVVHDRAEIQTVAPLHTEHYVVGGCTALYDAVGGAIHHIGNVHKYARPEDVPAHTVFVITTDGMENASHRYDRRRVREMIKRQQERYGWEFIFLASNINAEDAAEEIGIRRERAVTHRQDQKGVEGSYRAMCEAITTVRVMGDLDAGEWRKELDGESARAGKR